VFPFSSFATAAAASWLKQKVESSQCGGGEEQQVVILKDCGFLKPFTFVAFD
jgi:hypothetical protein